MPVGRSTPVASRPAHSSGKVKSQSLPAAITERAKALKLGKAAGVTKDPVTGAVCYQFARGTLLTTSAGKPAGMIAPSFQGGEVRLCEAVVARAVKEKAGGFQTAELFESQTNNKFEKAFIYSTGDSVVQVIRR